MSLDPIVMEIKMPEFIVVARLTHSLSQQVTALNPEEAIQNAKNSPNNWRLPDQKDYTYEVQEISPEPVKVNHFHQAKSVSQLLGMLGGATSVCWDNVNSAGVFQSERASWFIDQAIERLKEILSNVTAE